MQTRKARWGDRRSRGWRGRDGILVPRRRFGLRHVQGGRVVGRGSDRRGGRWGLLERIQHRWRGIRGQIVQW